MNKSYITLCLFLLFVNAFSQENLTNNTNKTTFNETYAEDEAVKKYFKVAVDCLLRNTKDESNLALQKIYNRTRDDILLTFSRMSQFTYDLDFQNLLEKCKKFAIFEGKSRNKKNVIKNDDCEEDFNYVTGTLIENVDECLRKKNLINKTGTNETLIGLETGNISDDKRIINKMKEGVGKEELEYFIKNEIVNKHNKTKVNETKVNKKKVNETKENDKKTKEKDNKRELLSFIKKVTKKTRNLKY